MKTLDARWAELMKKLARPTKLKKRIGEGFIEAYKKPGYIFAGRYVEAAIAAGRLEELFDVAFDLGCWRELVGATTAAGRWEELFNAMAARGCWRELVDDAIVRARLDSLISAAISRGCWDRLEKHLTNKQKVKILEFYETKA